MNRNLQELIDKQRAESFRPDVQVSDERVLGVLIAHHLRWNGDAILEVAAAALEDANFHIEADEIRDLMEKAT